MPDGRKDQELHRVGQPGGVHFHFCDGESPADARSGSAETGLGKSEVEMMRCKTYPARKVIRCE